jgi:hypothetical protein
LKKKRKSPFCVQFGFSVAIVTAAIREGISLAGISLTIDDSSGSNWSTCLLNHLEMLRSVVTDFRRIPQAQLSFYNNQMYSAAYFTEYTGLNYQAQITQGCHTLHHLSTPSSGTQCHVWETVRAWLGITKAERGAVRCVFAANFSESFISRVGTSRNEKHWNWLEGEFITLSGRVNKTEELSITVGSGITLAVNICSTGWVFTSE